MVVCALLCLSTTQRYQVDRLSLSLTLRPGRSTPDRLYARRLSRGLFIPCFIAYCCGQNSMGTPATVMLHASSVLLSAQQSSAVSCRPKGWPAPVLVVQKQLNLHIPSQSPPAQASLASLLQQRLNRGPAVLQRGMFQSLLSLKAAMQMSRHLLARSGALWSRWKV